MATTPFEPPLLLCNQSFLIEFKSSYLIHLFGTIISYNTLPFFLESAITRRTSGRQNRGRRRASEIEAETEVQAEDGSVAKISRGQRLFGARGSLQVSGFFVMTINLNSASLLRPVRPGVGVKSSPNFPRFTQMLPQRILHKK